MGDDEFRNYLFSYSHNGSRWSFEILAESPEDACERVSRLAFASYDGEVMGVIPAGSGRFVPWLTRILNLGRRVLAR